MTAQHTPGPWAKDRRGNLLGSNGTQVAVWDAGVAWSHRDSETEANARLIAAAPDLLAALEGVLRVSDRKTAEYDAAREAIARAKGGAA